jgi:hypothetical protein
VQRNPVDVVVEEAGVVTPRLGGQRLDAGPRGEGRAGLVEGDVTVRADAEDLQVDAAGIGDGLLVGTAGGLEVRRESVEALDAGRVDVDLGDEVPLDDVPVPLGMVLRESDVLVEQEGSGASEGQVAGRDAA